MVILEKDENKEFIDWLTTDKSLWREIISSNEFSRYEDKLNSYFAKAINVKNEGRVWFLLGEKENGAKTVINVGQSLDIKKELTVILKKIQGEPSAVKKNYQELIESYKRATFYEVNIDTYLEKVIQCLEISKKEEFQKYSKIKLIKDYLVEVDLAYRSGAEKWNTYRSGMDHRIYKEFYKGS